VTIDSLSTFLLVAITLAIAGGLYTVARWLDQWRRVFLVRREKRLAATLAVRRRLHLVTSWPAEEPRPVDPWLINESSLTDDLASSLTVDGGGREARPRDLGAHNPQSLHGNQVRCLTSAPLRSRNGHRMTP